MDLRQSVSRIAALFRYHRTRQFAWRIRRIAERKTRSLLPAKTVFHASEIAADWRPGARTVCIQIANKRLQLWPDRRSVAVEIGRGRFRFLNQTLCLGSEPTKDGFKIDWNPDAPRLWRFHLQCQEFLLELADSVSMEVAYALIASWLTEPRHQSPMGDPDAWHPFCISRRLPVWLSLAAICDPPPPLAQAFWCSISNQVAWLRRHCEWDLGGNHLLENLTALYLADSLLQLESSTSPSQTLDSLVQQLDEQILPSGEHCERSPTYHALMMVCVLQSIEAAQFAAEQHCDRLKNISSQMLQFAMWIRQPSGCLPLLGDSSQSETPELEHLLAWAQEHWDATTVTQPTMDYWANQSDQSDRILFDTGALACDHLPAHGHADLLQITVNLSGREAIVDTGNFEYAPTALRQRCRGTAAHNVMQLGAREQCDTWSSFRMGRRGHVVWKQCGRSADHSWCAAAHDGYGCLAGRVIIASKLDWTVIDWFTGSDEALAATTRLHWHPEWKLFLQASAQTFSASHVDSPDHSYVVRLIGESCRTEIEESIYCPNFGERQPNSVIVHSIEPSSAGWLGYVIPLHPGPPPAAPTVLWGGHRIDLTLANGDSLAIHLDRGVAMETFTGP